MLENGLRRRNAWVLAALWAVGTVGCGGSSDNNDSNDDASGKGGSESSAGNNASSTSPNVSTALQGTGDECQSYTEPADGKCAGWYCGVTEQELVDAVDPDGICGSSVALLCDGRAVAKVGTCARQLKAENFEKSNEELEPLVRECVYTDDDIKAAVSEDCLNCVIGAAACAAAIAPPATPAGVRPAATKACSAAESYPRRSSDTTP